jgi:quercetin dioxygenase-like cupin family protein
VSTTEAFHPAAWSKALDDVDWTIYANPGLPGRAHIPRFKVLSANIVVALYPPGSSSPRHAHSYDTTYYVMEGAIRFGDEQWVTPNSVHTVRAGHTDGPEEAHPVVGVMFLLVSSGPIDIGWAEQR